MLEATRLVLVLYTARHVAQGLRLDSSGHSSENGCLHAPWDECSSEDEGSLQRLPLRDTTQAENISINCPSFVNPDVQQLIVTTRTGPVQVPHAQSRTDSGDAHTYLFVLAAPHTSSTGVLSLLATSPRASTLCDAQTAACEGTWLLEKAGMLTMDNRWQSDVPSDWNAALDKYAEWWNSSQQVLIDKSPPNIMKAERIWSQLSQSGKRVKFLIMTRSPCYKGSWMGMKDDQVQVWNSQMMALMNDASNLPKSSYLHLRHEDLLSHPYQQARKILEFLPELQSLDPNKNGLNGDTNLCHPACKSLVEYVLYREPFKNQKETVNGSVAIDFMKMFGHI